MPFWPPRLCSAPTRAAHAVVVPPPSQAELDVLRATHKQQLAAVTNSEQAARDELEELKGAATAIAEELRGHLGRHSACCSLDSADGGVCRRFCPL